MTTDSSHPPAPPGEAPNAATGSAGDAPLPPPEVAAPEEDDPVEDSDSQPVDLAANVPTNVPTDPAPVRAQPHRRAEPSLLGARAAPGWSLELPEFEGPLDLLLHLVRRHELDILDIPIAFVTQRYLEYLEFMRALDLEVAGDYLVMAATLAYLKSRELVPSEPAEEEVEGTSDLEGPDPREELIARLLEYQKFRAAAADLDRLPISGRDVFSRGAAIELPPFDPGLAPITLYRLAEAYHRVLDRARINKSHVVVLEEVSVSRRMEQLTLLLIDRPKVSFEALFLERTWSSEEELRSMLVITLMSILELTKLGVIHVHQPLDSETIMIERKATPEEARRAISGYDEASSFGAVPIPRLDEEEEGSADEDAAPVLAQDAGRAGREPEGAVPRSGAPVPPEPDAAIAESEAVAPKTGSGEPAPAQTAAPNEAESVSDDHALAPSETVPLPTAQPGAVRDPPDSDA